MQSASAKLTLMLLPTTETAYKSKIHLLSILAAQKQKYNVAMQLPPHIIANGMAAMFTATYTQLTNIPLVRTR